MSRYNQFKGRQIVDGANFDRKEEYMMNKKLTRVILAGILALFVATAVVVPTMASVYAATEPAPSAPPVNQDQTPVPQPPAPEPPKEGDNPHSGHH
jgi:hypothetical protein